MTDTRRLHRDRSRSPLLVIAAWAAVGVPLLWGVIQTLYKAALLFR